jgi:hypothetical protein
VAVTEDRPGGRPGPGDEPIGTVAEEAAKLLSALTGYARGQAGEYADAANGAASTASAAFRSVNEHLATGAPECTWCPVCQVVHAVRSTSPEVKTHLAVAANALVQAAAAVLATHVPGDPGGGQGGGPVQKIDLDDDGWEDS